MLAIVAICTAIAISFLIWDALIEEDLLRLAVTVLLIPVGIAILICILQTDASAHIRTVTDTLR